MTAPTPATDQRQRRIGAALLIAIVGLLLGLIGRLVYIQTSLRADLLAKAQRQQRGDSVLPARRGRILDSRGRVVAATQVKPDVFVDPSGVDDLDELAAELSARINVPAERILEKINRRPNSRYVVVATGVDTVTADAVRSMGSRAVGLTNRTTRVYPLGESLAHVLGFVGRDGHGLEGLELSLDEHLAGRDGHIGSIRDARRRLLWRSQGEHRPPVDGGDVVLTIDAEIQRITEEALGQRVEKFEAQGGVAIVMVPRTGEVLAMANLPTFDPNHASSVVADVRRNRAVTDPVEPGSTFKPFIACGALEGGFVSTTELIDCHMGQHRFGSRVVTDSHPCGLLDLTGIIVQSSNIGMATIGVRMGNQALHDTVRRFGFGERTGIECPGESPGLVREVSKWDSFSTTSVPFGYEITATPLQLITAFSAIITDGMLVKPKLVRKLVGPDGTIVESFETPKIVRRSVSSRIARYIAQEALVGVAEKPSLRRALAGPHRVLGKTGTAKLLYADRGLYEPGAYLSLFIGAAPASDPQVVALVMVRRPKASLGYYGAVVSAPGVGEILTATLAYLEVAPVEKVALGR